MMILRRIKITIEKTFARLFPDIYLLNPKDVLAVLGFLSKPRLRVSFLKRLFILKRLYAISRAVDCSHSQYDILQFIESIFSIPPDVEGCIVEAGCFKGGSTAKFSIAVKEANRQFKVFDSFKGIPHHNERHERDIFGDKIDLRPGILSGTLEEVKSNISRYGEFDICALIPGWFDDTMPDFSESIAAIYLDVDLASSTRTCLKYLYPLLVPGGVLYSHDGMFPIVIDVFNDAEFWEKEVCYPKPHVEGLGKQKLIKIVKPID